MTIDQVMNFVTGLAIVAAIAWIVWTIFDIRRIAKDNFFGVSDSFPLMTMLIIGGLTAFVWLVYNIGVFVRNVFNLRG